MHKQNGLTAIEVVIVITIISIMIVIGVFSMRGIQMSARDKEVENDAQAFVDFIEAKYKENSQYIPLPAQGAMSNPTTKKAYFDQFKDLDSKVLENSNGGKGFRFPAVNSGIPACTSATKSCYKQEIPVVADLAFGEFIYRPLSGKNPEYVCAMGGTADDCRAFEVYYKLEQSPTVLRVLTGKYK